MFDYKKFVTGKKARTKKGGWGVMSKKRVVRRKRTAKALKRKACRSK